MKRRGNKSSKVPNVKLRPAQQGALPRILRADHSTCWAEDSQAGSDDTSVMDLCPRPFKGVVVCATGVVDKPTLFKQALELGATSVSAFTDRVTHLVAMDHGGAKYMCALERKIPILMPSWITDSYKVWLRGDDVDFDESVKNHRLPIFSGVVLCPSGITDITRRTQINKLLTEHQGVYMKNLERPVKVTHLLCSGDEETDKMKYAEKFNKKGEANVHLVWEEWFWDSLEFGGRFDEQRYQARLPRPERKSIREQASSPPPSSAVASEQEEGPAHQQPLDNLEEEELAAVKTLPAVTLQLWGGLLKQRGYEVSDGALLRSPSKSQAPREPTSSPLREPMNKVDNGSIISQFRRSNSFAPPRVDASSSGLPQPFRRSRTMSAVNPQGGAMESFMASAPSLPEKHGESSSSANLVSSCLFAGLKFTALGEAKSQSVRSAIEENGGKLASEMEDEDVDYIIVRLVSGSKLYRQEPDEAQRKKYRTECWLERCIFEDRLCQPQDHVSFLPLIIQTPVSGADIINLSFSGFDQSEACWITRLLRALGISLSPFFSRRSTHLLCPSGSGAKFDKACEWGIPVITMGWLATIATSGMIPPVTEYLVPGSSSESSSLNIDLKGKGKAVDKGGAKGQLKDLGMEMLDKSMVNDTIAQVPLQLINDIRSSSPRRNPPAAMSFGQPTGLLGHPPLPPERGRSPVTTPIRSGPPGRPTPQEIERERKQTRIPSSKSPSPMKIPHKTSRMISASPTKLPREATKALQDNITSLLGKRLSPEDDTAPSTPAGKRARPQRKTQTRQPAAAIAPPEILPVSALYTDSMSPFESYDEQSLIDSAPIEESMRVVYEDPGQRDEKKRLMNLLGDTSPEGPGGSNTKNGKVVRTRRSTRVAGF